MAIEIPNASCPDTHCPHTIETRQGGSAFKLKEGKLRSDTRTKFFTLRVVEHLNRLPGEAVDALSVEGF